MIITSEMNPVAAKATFKPSAIFDEVVVFIRYVFSINCTLEKDSSQELREDFIVGASHHILHHKYILEA